MTAVDEGDIVAVWFSCGAASAVAAKLTLRKYPQADIRILNCPIAEEDDDNIRFKHDVADWLGRKIETVVNPTYATASCKVVWERRKFMSGPKGAPCTLELKKRARQIWEKENRPAWNVLGFTYDEKNRAERFRLTERENLIAVLVDEKMTKQQCFDILRADGVRLPRVYGLGYPNANCLGCVKATSPTYWNHVRAVHPKVFNERAEQSRAIGAKLVRVKGKRIFLDELDQKIKGRGMKSFDFECGIFCEEIK